MRIDAIDQSPHRSSSEDEEVGAVVSKKSVAHHFKRAHPHAEGEDRMPAVFSSFRAERANMNSATSIMNPLGKHGAGWS
eukprot:11209926-Heterocapsa_arctica.AAC.1